MFLHTISLKNLMSCALTNKLVNFEQLSPEPELYFFSCSTQLSMKFFLLINVKMSTVLTFMSRKNSILSFPEPAEKLNFLIFYTYEHLKFNAQLS